MKPTTTKLEQGIPIPARQPTGGIKALLSKMKAGESFVVPTLAERNSIFMGAKRAKIPVTTRKLNGDGFRIWRVK